MEKKCNVFVRNDVDSTTKTICVFTTENKEIMINFIADYLIKNELDEDDEYSTIKTSEECVKCAEHIVNGSMLDLDFTLYYLIETILIE